MDNYPKDWTEEDIEDFKRWREDYFGGYSEEEPNRLVILIGLGLLSLFLWWVF